MGLTFKPDVDDLRESTELDYELTGAIITNGGWHFTYLGDENFIREKINSFCGRLNSSLVIFFSDKVLILSLG